MSTNIDPVHGSQAEGDDPAAPADERVQVEAPSGKPSQAEGEDPRDEVHEVLDADPASD